MSTFQQIVPVANKIIKKYDLCDNCLGRLFSKRLHLSSNKILGKKLYLHLRHEKKCYICRNLFDNLDHFLKLMLEKSSDYSFATFGVGAMIKPSLVDRDDFIRSQYKLKGIDSVKTDITKELGKLYSRKTKKILDPIDPEVTLTVNLKEGICELRSKSVTLSGRYLKPTRGFPQKQKPCDNCLGKGCRMCNFHGIAEFDSVEGAISKLLFKKFGGTTAKFTWIGGEDKSSLVLGSGRPFFVKIQNPFKRKARLPKVIDADSLKINNMKLVYNSPKRSLKFNSFIRVKVAAESQIDSKNLKKLKDLASNPVVMYDKSGKRSEKKIFDVKYTKSQADTFTLTIKAEGGLSIKRFVNGDDVTPSISKILNVPCVCKEFDFLDIELCDISKQ